MAIKQKLYTYELPQNKFIDEEKKGDVPQILRIIREGDEEYSERKEDIVHFWKQYYLGRMRMEQDGIKRKRGTLGFDSVKSQIRKEGEHNYDIIINQKKGKNLSDKAQEVENQFKAYSEAIQKKLFSLGLDKTGTLKKLEQMREERAVQGLSPLFVTRTNNKRYPYKVVNKRLSEIKLPKGTTDCSQLRKFVLLFNVNDYDEFRSEFKDVEGIEDVAWGNLPCMSIEDELKDMESTGREGQYAIYVDLDEKKAIWVAGRNAEVIRELSGDSFPWIMDGEPACPVFFFYYAWKKESPWGLGIMDMLSQDNQVKEDLDNANIQAHIDASKQRNIIYYQEDQREDVIQQIIDGELDYQDGKTVNLLVPQRVGVASPPAANSIGGGAGIQESGAINQLLDESVKGAGIRRGDVEYERGKLVGIAEIEAQNSQNEAERTAKLNADEIQRLYQMCFEYHKNYASTDDDEIVPVKGLEVNLPDNDATFGEVVSMMKNSNAYVKIDAESGVRPNPVIERGKLKDAMEVATQPATTQGHAELQYSLIKNLGYNIDEKKFIPQQNEQPTQ